MSQLHPPGNERGEQRDGGRDHHPVLESKASDVGSCASLLDHQSLNYRAAVVLCVAARLQ
jgi:hypothetical protein